MIRFAILCLCLVHGTFSQIHDGDVSTRVQELEDLVQSLSKQLMQERLFVEERIRSEGSSGVKQVRLYHAGTSPYFVDTHIGASAGAIHDHSDYDGTYGMGEIIAVLNGVEFRTRHNDFKLRMPSPTSSNYQETRMIDLPPVPPEVLNKATVQEQVAEMRQWFRAFKEQDTSIRDYRAYFRPNLCILEGAWTLTGANIDEPFQSDRHHIDASTWDDLVEKIQFTAYTGGKDNLENFAYLPSKVYSIENNALKVAQWNYRIICNPVSFDVPTSNFKLQNDLSSRLARRVPFGKAAASRTARFTINEFGTEQETVYTLLDKMMYEFPGLDNYPGNLTEQVFGLTALDVDSDQVLDASRYTRWYKYNREGAMGVSTNHRGFNDANLWVASNSQPMIMPTSVTDCASSVCLKNTRRVSYAVPLEVIYTSPLTNWNPYDIEYSKTEAPYVKEGGRNGGTTPDKAYNGTDFKTFYRTPAEFFKDNTVEFDYADTAQDSVGVLDKQGNVRYMAASGPRIVTPNIDGVGSVRLRYPIFPVHSQGGTVGEELEALKTVVMKMNQYAYLLEEIPGGQINGTSPDVHFILGETHQDPPGAHAHEFFLPRTQLAELQAGKDIKVTTSFGLGHQHELILHYDQAGDFYRYVTCDGLQACWDGHPIRLVLDS